MHNDVLPTRPTAPQPAKPENKAFTSNRRSAWRDFGGAIAIFAGAIFVAFLIIAFVFRSYQVDGPSMESTLQNNDKLIIWKLPRTIAGITGHAYIPHRGDIIVFNESGLAQFGQQNKKQLIKRVIGLPGDRVTIQNNEYIVYDSAHPAGFDPDKTLSYGKNLAQTTGTVDVALGKDQIFVSGDNRPDSLDSRAFGPINASQIVGKLAVRVFPISKAKEF